MLKRDYKHQFTLLAMKVASEIASATETKIKEYIEKNKPEKAGVFEPLLTDAERNSYLASERANQYSGAGNKRDLNMH